MDDSWRCGGIFPLRDDAIFFAAVIIAYSGVDVGLVIYFCLKKNVPDIIGVRVSFNHSCQQ